MVSGLSRLESVVRSIESRFKGGVLATAVAGTMLFSYFQPQAHIGQPPEDLVSASSTPAPHFMTVDGSGIDGKILQNLGATIEWKNPAGTTQYQIRVMPYNNDGPGINLIRNKEERFIINPPDVEKSKDFVMLPGMEYTASVRATFSRNSISEDSPEWGPWRSIKFRTPVPQYNLEAVSPAVNARENNVEKVRWNGHNKELFYYEVQLSPAEDFSSSWVWYNFVHTGNTQNSWDLPEQLSGTYYWRVRPRVQGDGVELPWGPVWSFTAENAQGQSPAAPLVPKHEENKTPQETSPVVDATSKISGIVFQDYNGNGILNSGEPLVANARVSFVQNNVEKTVVSSAEGRYSVQVDRGANTLSVNARSQSGAVLDYFFPSISDLYKMDQGRKFGVNITEDTQFNIGLAEGRNTLPFSFGTAYQIVQPFTPTHNGLDYKIATGVPIVAAAPGEVALSGHVECRSPNEKEQVPHLEVILRHPDGGSTLYGHLSRTAVTAGQSVRRGDLLGYSGNGGFPVCSRGPHLHFSDGVNTGFVGGVYFNPEANWTAPSAQFSR